MVVEGFLLWAQQLIITFSYLAVFIVSIISTSTILFPFPLYLILFFTSTLGLNPLIVGVVAGIGAAIGELTGYLVGIGGRYVVEEQRLNKKVRKTVKFFTKLFKRYGFIVIVITAAIPFPFDVIGILAGIGNYNIKKFFVATALGKMIKSLVIVYSGVVAIPFVELYLSSIL
jgi:membrane protein DedA with SNARE-associated domain